MSAPGQSGGQPPDLSNLQENFNQQQAKITALKELVRQSDQSQNQEAQEKVKNIAKRLNVLKSKATKGRLDKSTSDLDVSTTDLSLDMSTHNESAMSSSGSTMNRSRAETPGSEKIQLLRQQMELNRKKMAERESSKRDIEVMVSQLKAKFDDTQQSLHRSQELGRSMGDLSSIGGHSTDRDKIRQLEAKVRILETELAAAESGSRSDRVNELETKILDLEETIKEKDSLIHARTQAVTLMSENLSMKGKNTVDLLEDTQVEMVKMQENFVHQEMSLKDEIDALNQRLADREGKIANLEEVVDILETTRYDLTVKNAELLNQLNDVREYSSKLEELNMLNQQLQHRIADLEQQLNEEDPDSGAEKGDKMKIESSSTGNEELLRINEELQSQVEKLKLLANSDLIEKFTSLEKSYEEQSSRTSELEEKLTEKTVELSVLQANFAALDEKLQSTVPKSLFSSMADEAEEDASSQSEVLKLKAQLDEANKSQIKTKLKMKQMQKQMDSLKKASDQNRQIIQLQEENEKLQQKVSDLQEQQQPGSDSDAVLVADDSEMGKKIQALELTCHNQTAAINLLEEQKVDLAEDLNETKAELEQMRSQMDARAFNTVKSEISSIELEEQLELHIQDKASLTLQVEDLNEVVSNLKEQMRKLKDEKVHLDNENLKLLEKLDKLSEKVSSAESIEILENLTHQERLEMESLEKKREDKQQVDKLQESAEMSQKIELFTTERKEVLEKMERVKAENSELLERIEELEDKERQLLSERDELMGRCTSLEESMVTAEKESKLLTEKVSMMEKLESDSSTPGTPQKTVVNRDTLRESLNTLDTEVENYMKCKDKNGKLATSKKLAKQAKNCVTQFKDLIEAGAGGSSEGGEKEKEEIDRLKGMLIESTNVKVEKEQLEEELKSVRTALMEANNAQEDMRGQISVLLGKLSQKDELLEEHETDTAKLLTDIKMLQEKSAQENIDSEEANELRRKLENANQELKDVQRSSEELQREVQKLSHELVESERREAAFDVEKGTMKELIAEQKKQLIDQLVEHENELTEKVENIQSLEEKLNQMARNLDALKRDSPDEAELIKLKEEIQFKQETIDTLNGQIMDLYKSMDGNTTALLEREDEIVDLREIIEGNETRLKSYEEKCADYESKIQEMETKLREVEEKNSRAANATDDVKIGLEQRIQELEAIVQELDTKNKEQLEKLKKFAANLKKKVAQCNELEKELKKRGDGQQQGQEELNAKEQLLQQRQSQIEENLRKILSLEQTLQRLEDAMNEREDELVVAENRGAHLKKRCDDLEKQLESREKESPDNSELVDKVAQLESALAEANQLFLDKDENIKELNASRVEMEEKITALNESLQTKTKEVEKCKIIIKKRMKEIQELKQQTPPQGEGSNSAEQQELIQRLQNQIQEYEHYRNEVHAVYIESMETENREMKAKIQKLEEGIARIEERRNSMEQKVSLLGATLEEKSSEFQQNEDMLVQRLSTLSAHDEVIMNQLTAIKQENEDLLESVEEHIKQEQSLHAKAKELESELNRVRTNVVANLEQEVQNLNYQLWHDSQEKKKHTEELERKLREKDKEIEDMESELSNQFVQFEEKRKELQEQQEKLVEERDNLTEEIGQLKICLEDMDAGRVAQNEELNRLKSQCDNLSQDDEEIKELRMQVVQDQMEIEHLKAQNLDLSQSHEQELDRLRCEIINLQENNQIDLLRADLEKFQRELVEKDREIESLARRCEEEVKSSQSKSDLIDTLASKVHDINEKQLTDFNDFSATLNALKGELAQREHEVANLTGEISRNAHIIVDLQGQLSEATKMNVAPGHSSEQDVEHWKRLIEEKDAEIANYQQRTLQLQMAASLGGGHDADPFATVSAPAPSVPQVNVEEMRTEYEQRILAMEETLRVTLERSQAVERDLTNLSEKYSVSQNHLLERDDNLQSLSAKFQETQALCLERNAQVERLQREVAELQEEIKREHSRHAVEEVVQVAQQHILAAVPIQEEIFVQRSDSIVQRDAPIGQEVHQLREELDRIRMQLTEKSLELDMALSRIRELEAERVAKKETKVAEKQVAQVSPQQIPEGHNIPAFSTAQFFDPTPTPSTASFFDQPAGQVIPPQQQQQPEGGAMGGASADVTDYDNRVPVEEEMIVPKKAYLCYPDAEQVQPDASSMTPNVDDSWGWNPEEAALEEQHHRMTYQSTSAAAPVTDQRIHQLEDKIQELELERDRQRNEIHEFQLKSAKMLKKLKEYKAVNDNLSRQKSVDSSNDLDVAIQEELKEQVRVLEAKLREDSEKKDKEQHEKESLSSRIVQLTATNSRLTEMKQAQELEIERHLTEIRHLRSELQKMNDWGEDGFGGGGGGGGSAQRVEQGQGEREGSVESVKELENKITDLAADNDDLQAILEEERDANKKLEERLKKVNESHSQSEEVAQRRIAELERQLKESVELIDTLTRDSQAIKVHLDRLASEHQSLLAQQSGGSANVREIEERLQNLVAEMEYKNVYVAQAKEMLETQAKELEEMKESLREKENVIARLTEDVKGLQEEVEKKRAAQEEVPSSGEVKVGEDYQKICEELRAEKASMEHELQVLNDQVLASLEMEDKVRAMALEFDVKQIEINELKATIEQLRAATGKDVSASGQTSTVDQNPFAEVEQLRAQIDQLNQYWTDAVEQRGNEVAESWKMHLETVEQDYNSRIECLDRQLEELQGRIADLEQAKESSTEARPEVIPPVAILPLDDVDVGEQGASASEVETMKAALESQEMEIVTLKEQLAIRSAEFAALSARLDPYGNRAAKATSNMASVQPKLAKSSTAGAGVGGVAPSGSGATTSGVIGAKKREQNELDLALYMLHQRDMRCEELTHELLILLEERDTLQLKWSDSMRQLETVRRTEGSGAVTTSGESSENNSPEKVATGVEGVGVAGTFGAGGAAVAGGIADDLDAK